MLRPVGLTVMATTKLEFDTIRYTVIRRNDGSIAIAPKGKVAVKFVVADGLPPWISVEPLGDDIRNVHETHRRASKRTNMPGLLGASQRLRMGRARSAADCRQTRACLGPFPAATTISRSLS
jgi:hypothetical protein